jgi:putative lipoic acid-binding regulatory protein
MTSISRKNENTKLTGQKPLRMNNEELQFPVTFRLKAVLTTTISESENKKQLVDLFKELNIGYFFHGKSHSKKGTYVSFTYEITLQNREIMHRLYTRLNEIDNLKFAL